MSNQFIQNLIQKNQSIHHFKRNEYIVKEGVCDTNIYWVQKGTLQIYILINGQEQIIRFAYEGDIFLCLDSFFTQNPTKFYIQAIKSGIYYKIPKQELLKELEQSSDNKLWWETSLIQLVLQQQEREIDLLIDDPKERYNRVLSRSPQLFQLIPHRYIANYLRMSPETLSRIKKY